MLDAVAHDEMPPDDASTWLTSVMHAGSPLEPNSGVGDLFQVFRDGKARTKSELAGLTGLARSTISSRLAALQASGLLVPVGVATSNGGRPPAKIAFNADAGVVLAIDLGATHATVAVTNLAADVSELVTTTMDIAEGPLPILDRVFEIGAKLLAEHDGERRLVGVGIGVPGPVEHSTGRPTNPPIMPGWDRFDIPRYTQEQFDVPVLVDNDVNILALGEHSLRWPHVAESAVRQGRDRYRTRHHRGRCAAARRPRFGGRSRSRPGSTKPWIDTPRR